MRLKAALEYDKPFDGEGKVFRVSGQYSIVSSISNATFKSDGMTKFLLTGEKVVIENCVFDVDGQSVDRSLIDCLASEVVLRNCTIKNIRSNNGNGAYGVYVDIVNCSSEIVSCNFINISDAREETDPVGEIKGMCGGVYYTCAKSVLTATPQKQIADNLYLEDIYTSLPNGDLNEKSFDADGIRIFVNDAKTKKEYLYAQCFVLNSITGRDIQKRLIKISGASSCEIKNVRYKTNRKIGRKYPAHLIAVYDSYNIHISDVEYKGGCNDIAFCGSNSANVTIDGLSVKSNGRVFRKSTSSLFRINKCKNLKINRLNFSGAFYRLGQLSSSEDVSIEMYGRNVTCVVPFEIKNTKGIQISGEIKGVRNNTPALFKMEKVEGVTVEGNITEVEPQIFKYESLAVLRGKVRSRYVS